MSTTFQGLCGEAFVGTQRLVPARSPNMEDLRPNVNLALPPYNTVGGLLVETETCTRNSTQFSQSCPDEDREGFVFVDEFSPDWPYLGQTRGGNSIDLYFPILDPFLGGFSDLF